MSAINLQPLCKCNFGNVTYFSSVCLGLENYSPEVQKFNLNTIVFTLSLLYMGFRQHSLALLRHGKTIIIFLEKRTVVCAGCLVMIISFKFCFIFLSFLGEDILDHLHLCKFGIHPIVPPSHLVLLSCFENVASHFKACIMRWSTVELPVWPVNLLEVRICISIHHSLWYCDEWILRT